MIPSTARSMASQSTSASGRSNFAMMPALPPCSETSVRSASQSAARRTKDWPRKSTPSPRAKRTSAWSLSVRQGVERVLCGRLMPFRFSSRPPRTTLAAHFGVLDLPHFELDDSVGEQHGISGRDIARERGVLGRNQARATAYLARGHRHRGALRELDASLLEVSDPDLRTREVGEHGHGAARRRRHPARAVESPAMGVVIAVRHVQPEHVRTRVEQPPDGPLVARGRPQGGDDLGAAPAEELNIVVDGHGPSPSRAPWSPAPMMGVGKTNA